MPSDLKQLEPRLKEILYRCLEDVRATKAALYLLDGNDTYDLVTQYGYRDNAVIAKVTGDHAIVDRLITKRAPFFVNGLAAEPRLSEMMYRADTTRLLIAPLYARGRLVGFVDLRDKARQAPFEPADLTATQKIVDVFSDLLTEQKFFAQPVVQPQVRTAAPVIETTVEAATQSMVANVIQDAQAMISRGVLRPRPQADVVSERHLTAASLALPAIIGLPGVVLASVSPISRLGGSQFVAARTEVTAAAMEQFEAKIRTWLKKRGESGPVAARTTMIFPYGTAGVPIEPARIMSVLSAPVRVGSQEGIVLSVGFEMQPDAAMHANLEKFLQNVQQLAALASTADAVADLRQRVADRLLEPEFQSFGPLVTHSKRVADLAEQLARHIGCDEAEVDSIRVAALLHDVGMRFLDYRSLYRKAGLSSDDLRTLRQHPVVGAAVVAELFGTEVATMILSHHERPDGAGYPDGLNGEEIPLGSRVIHICEAFDAMTSTDSYQTPVLPHAAAAKIKRAAGSQFDAELSVKFLEMLGLN